MATEQTTDRGAPNVTVVEGSRGGGFGAIIAGIALLVLVAIVAVFLINRNANDNSQTAAITGAARDVSEAAGNAASNVSEAADRAADSVAR